MKLIFSIFLLIFIPLVSSAQSTVEIREEQGVPTQVGNNATSTTPFSYSCVQGQTLTSFSFYTRSGSASRSMALKVDSTTYATNTITATPAWTQWNSLNSTCTDGTFDITFVYPASTFYVYGQQGDTNGNYKMVYNHSGGAIGALHRATFTYSAGSTTYVPVNQYVTSLECVNGTPTTTCSFDYSTSTATTTYDYRPYFDYITLFVGLLFFALGVYLFRSVAIKYLK